MPVFPEDVDVRCMLAMKAGRATALDELMQRHAARLVAFLRHYTANQDDAEDLAQETFASIWRVRATYTPRARFSTWLYRIAVNHALNHKRRAQLRRVDQLLPEGHVAPEGDASALTVRDEATLRVRTALDELPAQQRVVLMLRCYEDFSYEEICESMNLGMSAVKSLLFRARQNLKTLLAADIELVRLLMEPGRRNRTDAHG